MPFTIGDGRARRQQRPVCYVFMAGRHAYLRRARHWIENRGWRGFLEEVWYRLQMLAQGKPLPGRENGNTAAHPFDTAYGVETGGLVWGEALQRPTSEDSAYWATGYYGISPSAFTAALQRLQLEWRRFTFVDIGCGKGRALLLALRFPFRRALGVELSPALAAVAQNNLRLFHAEWRRANVPAEVIAGDATTTPLPEGPLVLFLYHPFAAPVMKRFLEHVLASAKASAREIHLLYANPELAAMLESTPGLTLMWRDTFALTKEEGEADRFGSYGEVFAAYRVE